MPARSLWSVALFALAGCSEAPWVHAIDIDPPAPGAFFLAPVVPPEPRLILRVEVDVSESRLLPWDLEIVLGEINAVWAQAGICFDFRDVRQGHKGSLRLSFVAGDMAGLNGRYDDDRSIWALDAPSLYDAPH